MRALVYFVAVTLDGRIAGPDGSSDFFPVDDDYLRVMAEEWGDGLPTALHETMGTTPPGTRWDTVLMGRGTFGPAMAAGAASPYAHLVQYVFSRTLRPQNHPGVHVVADDPLAFVRRLKSESGGDIWLCGGGSLAATLMPEVDRLVLKLNPVVAGAGVPLVDGPFAPSTWRLVRQRVLPLGIVLLTYDRASGGGATAADRDGHGSAAQDAGPDPRRDRRRDTVSRTTGTTPGPRPVRIGTTMRRPTHPRSDLVQSLLLHLETVGFRGTPRALGYDESGREVVTFIDGDIPFAPPYQLDDARLLSATRLIKDYHDATVSSPLREDQEVVCHGDLGPHNTVFRGDTAVALIDFAGDLGPGQRAVDFAHAVWGFADVTDAAVPVQEQARRIRLMCEAYAGMTPTVVVGELGARFVRARAEHEQAGRTGAVAAFDRLLAWLDAHGKRLISG